MGGYSLPGGVLRGTGGGRSGNRERSGGGLNRPLAPSRHSCYYIPVIADFADQGTEDIFDQVNSPAARRTCPQRLWPVARSKMDALNRAGELQDLAQPPGNRLEALRGGRQGQHSIRINDQYRLCFSWRYGQATAVEIADYHR